MTFDDESEPRGAEKASVLAWLRQQRASRLVYALLESGGTDVDTLAAFITHKLVHPSLQPNQLHHAQGVLIALCRALLTGEEQGHLSAASLAFERSFQRDSEDDDDGGVVTEATQAMRPVEPMTSLRKTSPQTPGSRRSAGAEPGPETEATTTTATASSGTLRGFPPPIEAPTGEPPAASDTDRRSVAARDEGSTPQMPGNIDATGVIDVARLMTGFAKGDTAGLPFEPAPDLDEASPPPTASQRPPVAQAPHPATGATEAMDEADIAAAIASADAVNTKPSALPMPVEHYAALVVQSQQAGSMDRLERIHAAFSIESHAHRSEIDRAFTEALAKDETLRAYFTATLRRLTTGT